MALVQTTLNIDEVLIEKAGIPKDILKGEVAVVTGGASNIGLGYSRSIAAAGGSVVIADFNAEAGAETERVINEENGRDCALFVKTDVTKQEDIDNLAAKALAKFGKVDILIHNAMNMRLNGPILSSTIDELDQSYAISARGAAMLIKAFVPGMIERKHGTVAYSATQFHYAPPMVGGTVYTAGKAAATSVVMSLANEVKQIGQDPAPGGFGGFGAPAPTENKSGVNVFCYCPAGVMRFDPSKMPPPPPSKPGEPEMPKIDFSAFKMTTPEENAAAMVFCIQNAKKLHGSGVIHNDVFEAMGYPFHEVKPVKVPGAPEYRHLTDQELTMVFCYMGDGFSK